MMISYTWPPMIVIEGPDGVGKTTAVSNIVKLLNGLNLFCAVGVRNPGGTVFAEKIRRIMLDEYKNLSALSRQALSAACYGSVTQDLMNIGRKDTLIIADRVQIVSGLVYGLVVDNFPESSLKHFVAMCSEWFKPARVYILLDTYENIQSKLGVRGDGDYLDNQAENVKRSITEVYKNLTHEDIYMPEGSVIKIDIAGKTPETVAKEIVQDIMKTNIPTELIEGK
jgi:dTMP kinase